MSTLTGTPAHTEEMAVVHRVFRHGFPMVADLVRQTPPGAVSRAEPVATHLDFLLAGLHHHHTGEDENLWPLLLQRAALHAELVDRMETQHAVVAERSDRVHSLLEAWRSTAHDGESLAEAIDELTWALVEHLDDEEEHVVPLLRVHVTAEEWERFGEKTFEKFTNEEKLTATGTLEDVSTAEEAAWFTGGLPLPIKVMWRLVGRRRYERYLAQVRGTAPVAITSVRRAGAVCALAGLLGIASGVFLSVMPGQVPDTTFSYPLASGGFVAIQLFFAVQHVGLLLGIVALGSAGVLGASRPGRWGMWVAAIAMLVLAATEVIAIGAADATYPGPRTDPLDALYGSSSILIGAGLVVAGVAVARARAWGGWRRWIVLATGIYVFVPMIPALMGPFVLARLAISGWMLLFAGIGWALLHGRDSEEVGRR